MGRVTFLLVPSLQSTAPEINHSVSKVSYRMIRKQTYPKGVKFIHKTYIIISFLIVFAVAIILFVAPNVELLQNIFIFLCFTAFPIYGISKKKNGLFHHIFISFLLRELYSHSLLSMN